MSDKYVIQNCPARVLFTDGYFCRQADGNILCQDCTDCVMKQIVERCKRVKECTADICTNPYEYATYCETRGVLELLDIQEVE